MKIYNKEKTIILNNPDLEKGYLAKDTIVVQTVPAQDEVQEKFHYITIKEYANGGKDVEKVIDTKHKPAIEEHDEIEEIQVYIPYTVDEYLEKQKEKLREWRSQYLEIIDCAVWYDCLTHEDKEIVKQFRLALLDITKTMVKPAVPNCVLARL